MTPQPALHGLAAKVMLNASTRLKAKYVGRRTPQAANVGRIARRVAEKPTDPHNDMGAAMRLYCCDSVRELLAKGRE